MSQSSDDVAARGRAIFRRLRAQDPEPGSDPPQEPDGATTNGAPEAVEEEVGASGQMEAGSPLALEEGHRSVESEAPEQQGSVPGRSGGGDDVDYDNLTDEELALLTDPTSVPSSDPAPDPGAGPQPGLVPEPTVDPEPDAPESAVVLPVDEQVPVTSADAMVDPEAVSSAVETSVEGDEPSAEHDQVEARTPAALPTPGPLPGLVDLPTITLPEAPEAPTPPAAEISEAEAVPAPDAAPSPFARPLPRVMAIANQKGGVGKTTTAVNLGACLADIGYRVLVVDLDPQGNASTGMGVNIRDLQGSMYDVVLHDLPIEDCVEATSVRNLFCAPSSLELAGAEIELVPAFSRELRLKRALDEVRDDYDFILIDCPPSLGLLTVNAFAAASEVVVPIQCEYYALEGLGQLLRNVNLVQKNLNQTLEVSAIILVMYDARTKLADQVVNEVREHFGDKVCRQVVPRTVRLSEAPSFGQPIIAFDPSSRGAIAYRELAKEVSGGTPQRSR